MKLINCPACQNECSEQAASCPKCGHPFKTGQRQANRPNLANDASRPLPNNPDSTPLLIVAALFILLMLFCCFITRSDQDSIDRMNQETKEWEQRQMIGNRR